MQKPWRSSFGAEPLSIEGRTAPRGPLKLDDLIRLEPPPNDLMSPTQTHGADQMEPA